MEIRIIDEKTGNPFKYLRENDYSIQPRLYSKMSDVKCVMYELLKQLGLRENIECLEVGAGHNPHPSQALSQLGINIITLDSDWENERHTDISFDKLKELNEKFGKDLLIPQVGGRNGNVICYLGDVAFLRDLKSPLKDREFDLIYFWGSMNHNGFCSSVENSSTAREHGIKIDHSDRILTPIPAVKKDRYLISVAGYFCGHMSEEIKRIDYNNMKLAELGLYWALVGGRDAKVLGFFTQSPKSVIERQGIKDNPAKEILYKNPLEKIIQTNHYSIFGDENNYLKLREAQDRLNLSNKQKLENLGIIDAVFVGY